MKQKKLTEEQMAICEELKALLEKAWQADIKFVFDQNDYLLSAYNGDGIESVDSDYSTSMRQGDEKFDWTKTYDLTYPDCVNSSNEDVYINSKD